MQKRYSKEFKETLIAFYHSGQSVTQLSKEYDVAPATIYKWIDLYSKSNLPDAGRRRHRVRRADTDFHAFHPAHAALTWPRTRLATCRVAIPNCNACWRSCASTLRRTHCGSAATWSIAAASRWIRCG